MPPTVAAPESGRLLLPVEAGPESGLPSAPCPRAWVCGGFTQEQPPHTPGPHSGAIHLLFLGCGTRANVAAFEHHRAPSEIPWGCAELIDPTHRCEHFG
ncbi:hypothetical protein NDU88_006121 [Pleurodeles waltl]|uniref:Uncharacterized protein n=1 Tax=Pleurodeles waltl TaxID=8319 RepID=A0AAV7TVW9_PLEWA|nr:hypothetical protein NDU88_006121 [Pleurodeles waltl]